MSQQQAREQIRILHQVVKHNPKKISTILGVSLATVYNTIRKIKTGQTLKHKKGGGRKAIKSIAIMKSIRQQVRRSFGAITLDELNYNVSQRTGVACSKMTVRRTLKKMKYRKEFPRQTFMLSEKNRLKRIEWARNNEHRDWRNVIFCDEASFWLHGGKVKLWVKRGKHRSLPMPKHSAKIHVWAAWSSMGTFPLIVFNQNLTGHLYSKILEWGLLAQADALHAGDWVLLQDNDPKHTSKVVKSWMEENMPGKLMDWPSQSPDMNPIENLFGWMKGRLNRLPHKRPKTIKELKSKLNSLWDSITPEFLASYWESMPNRCQLLLENDGMKINY